MSKVPVYFNLQSVTQGFESRAQALNPNKYWLADANQHHQIQPLLARLDDIISKMPSDEKQELTKKFNDIIRSNVSNWNEQYDERFLDIFIEILGWGWLNDKYQGLTVKFRKIPDLVVMDDRGRVVAVMECKNFWRSREEAEYLESTLRSKENIKAREVDQRLVLNEPSENPFLRKLLGVLHKAEEQVNETGVQDNKFIFVNFSLDIASIIQPEGTKALLERRTTELRMKDIELIAFCSYDVNPSLI